MISALRRIAPKMLPIAGVAAGLSGCYNAPRSSEFVYVRPGCQVSTHSAGEARECTADVFCGEDSFHFKAYGSIFVKTSKILTLEKSPGPDDPVTNEISAGKAFIWVDDNEIHLPPGCDAFFDPGEKTAATSCYYVKGSVPKLFHNVTKVRDGIALKGDSLTYDPLAALGGFQKITLLIIAAGVSVYGLAKINASRS